MVPLYPTWPTVIGFMNWLGPAVIPCFEPSKPTTGTSLSFSQATRTLLVPFLFLFFLLDLKTPALYATDKGEVIPFSDAQTDTGVTFTNNTWRIGNSSTCSVPTPTGSFTTNYCIYFSIGRSRTIVSSTSDYKCS